MTGLRQITPPQVGQPLSPAQAMRIAIQEAARGAGFVAPNPLVGCVIVDGDHKFLSSGFHHRVGDDHAEIDALKKLPSPQQLRGAHVYVTLEPCAHQGRTPSCARTLAPLKPALVTYAVEDPNPLVAGQGAEILRAGGIATTLFSKRDDVGQVDRDELTLDAEEVAEIFLHHFRLKEPFVALKVASSLDGQMALASGDSKWITGEAARQQVHLLRARYDAIAIGADTFAKDDPSLNVRHEQYPDFQNRVVVFDSTGRTLSEMPRSNLLRARGPNSVFVITKPSLQVANPAGVKTIEVAMTDDGFDIQQLLQELNQRGITSIMVEGGAHAYAAFIRAERVQRLHAFLAPILMGGKNALGWASQFGIEQMSERLNLRHSRMEAVGPDFYFTAKF